MTEKALDDVVRCLRVAKEHLNLAMLYSTDTLHDHNVASDIHQVVLPLSDLTSELNSVYRSKHFRKDRR